jgi:hypothetical protein
VDALWVSFFVLSSALAFSSQESNQESSPSSVGKSTRQLASSILDANVLFVLGEASLLCGENN